MENRGLRIGTWTSVGEKAGGLRGNVTQEDRSMHPVWTVINLIRTIFRDAVSGLFVPTTHTVVSGLTPFAGGTLPGSPGVRRRTFNKH